MTIMNNEAAIAVLANAAQQLQALGIHCLLSPMSLPQGMTVSLHVGESMEATLAAEVAATHGGEMAHGADTASHFSKDVAELLTEATIQKAAHIPPSK
jgi:hypothetical protein